jgi:cytoplasmic tRNA 2-thiolation protein 2
MRATSADRMSRSILDAIASGRGESIADLSAIVDKRHARVQLLRPMKDISDKEIGIFNRFEQLDHLAIIIDHPSVIDQRSIQSTTSAFIDELQSHFPATISTILSTARKVVRKPTTTGAPSMSSRCRLCFALIDDAIFCICCERLFNEHIPDRTLLPDMFVCCDQ